MIIIEKNEELSQPKDVAAMLRDFARQYAECDLINEAFKCTFEGETFSIKYFCAESHGYYFIPFKSKLVIIKKGETIKLEEVIENENK